MELTVQNYPITSATLTPIHLFESVDRGVYKVEHPDGPPLLLRACRSGTWMAGRLAETAMALDVLAAMGYPAPIVQRTNDGSLLANYGEWAAQLLTFVEGELVSHSLCDLAEMGAMLARLHCLSSEYLRKIEPSIPNCRWHPKEKLKPWLKNLNAVAELIPEELQSRYRSCMEAVATVLLWPKLPISILHTDCNPQNAIRNKKGQITFIDWDGIGFGPAILDLAYLLFYCHILQDSWPTIKPNETWIDAILGGYSRNRALSPAESECLPSAIAFVECHHFARGLPDAVRGEWTQDRGLTRFYGREKVVPQIVEIAMKHHKSNQHE